MSKPNHLFVYGDSYSGKRCRQIGINAHLCLLYYSHKMRKSNGPLWSQSLSEAWSVEVKSYAKIGSHACASVSSLDLSKQIKASKDLSTMNKDSVYAIFFGVTDIVDTQDKSVKQIVDCIKNQVQSMRSDHPTMRLLLLGLPPLEYTPYYTNSTLKSTLKDRIMEFNVELEDAVTDWNNETEMNATFVDTYSLFSDVLGNPEKYSITQVEASYWDTCQGRCENPIDSYLWWDSLHMTGAGHKAIANYIISNHPIIQSYPQTPSSSSPDIFSNVTVPLHNATIHHGPASSSIDEASLSPLFYTQFILFLVSFIIISLIFLGRNRIINTLASIWQSHFLLSEIVRP
ncbi:GDSL-like Lipase/Acylhydrolase-domain-containing protein [Spinellus fusiger]|nr:GDSL-like Lipase/Acylhydrolase-domain-containing protein [Spinellus fusiger]